MIEFLEIINIIPVQWFSLLIAILSLGSFIFAGWQVKIMKKNKQLQETLNECLKHFLKKGE